MAGHAGVSHEVTGAVGVTVFFVLSGYLITGVLMTDEQRLMVFYAARAARLVPALLVVVLSVDVVWLVQGRSWRPLLEQSVAALLYLENFFEGRHHGQVLAHTWSLAVEEQFYLVWPFVLPLLLRLGHRARAALVFSTAGALVVLRLGLAVMDADHVAYASLPTNAYAMLLGGGVAVLPRPRVPTLPLTVAGLAVVTALGILGSRVPGGGITVAPLAAAGGLFLLLACLDENRLLSAQWLQFLGRISYSLYLWHWPLLWLTGTRNVGLGAWWVLLASGLVATASTLFLEDPVRRWFRRRVVPRLSASV